MNQIILITGGFGVGKDTYADELLKYMKAVGLNAGKILSKTTRPIRSDPGDEKTHTFTNIDEYNKDKDEEKVVAMTQIADNLYWTSEDQFKYDYNIYVVDKKGVYDLRNENPYIVELKTTQKYVDDKRLKRERQAKLIEEPTSHEIIYNNGTLQELLDCAPKTFENILNFIEGA